VLKKRPDLRVIVASATMDADELRKYFDLAGPRSPTTAAILSLEGRSHPVRVYYAEDPVADYVKASVETVMNIHKRTVSGDVLVSDLLLLVRSH
jgi:ATP-dependent RNA helicase DDX35